MVSSAEGEGAVVDLDDLDVARAASGNERAFAALLTSHRRIIESACAVVDLSPEDRLDAMQDARLAIWKGLKSFRGESTLSSWIYTVTRRAALACAKRGQKHRLNSAELDGEVDLRARLDIDAQIDLAATWDALGQLDMDHREVVILYAFADLTHAEIGSMLTISEGTSKARLHRARTEIARLVRVTE